METRRSQNKDRQIMRNRHSLVVFDSFWAAPWSLVATISTCPDLIIKKWASTSPWRRIFALGQLSAWLRINPSMEFFLFWGAETVLLVGIFQAWDPTVFFNHKTTYLFRIHAYINSIILLFGVTDSYAKSAWINNQIIPIAEIRLSTYASIQHLGSHVRIQRME